MGENVKIHIGDGILKPGTRPIKVHVDENGEYWICDKDVDPTTQTFRDAGCVAHSEVHLVK